nr:hypothetical protein [Ktedonobacterales bacterium]
NTPPPNRPPTPWNATPVPQRAAAQPRRRASGSPNRLLLGIAAALIVASLIIVGIIVLPNLFVTTVILKRVSPTSTAICANVAQFKAANAGNAVAAAPFADVPFPAGSLSYDGGTKNVGGATVHTLHTCSPSLNLVTTRSFFTTNMPAKGWSASSSFPANGDGKCGDAYCWSKGGHFVGLDTPTNGSGYVVYDVRLVP